MKTKQEYIDALVCITKEYYSTVRSTEEANKFKSYARLFKELVDEHFEEKQETNFEHYKDEIIEDGTWSLALVKGKLKRCRDVYCNDCVFSTSIKGGCLKKLREWLKQPYEKLIYQLTQFECDLIHTYSNCHESCKFSEFKQLMELKDKGYFKCVNDNTNIQDILANCEVIE